MEVCLGPGHIVVDGDQAPFPKRGDSPAQFSAHAYCVQAAGSIKMPLGVEVGLDPSDILLDGAQLPSPKRGQSPQFSAYVYCGQTAAWIKMPLGMQVGLGPGHIVLDGDPAPPLPQRGNNPAIFGPCLLWPNGWMDQGATWYEGRPLPRPHCVNGDPAPPQKGGITSRPICGPHLLWQNGRPSQLLLSTCFCYQCNAAFRPFILHRTPPAKLSYKSTSLGCLLA